MRNKNKFLHSLCVKEKFYLLYFQLNQTESNHFLYFLLLIIILFANNFYAFSINIRPIFTFPYFSNTPTTSICPVCGNISTGVTFFNTYPFLAKIFTSRAKVAGLQEI